MLVLLKRNSCLIAFKIKCFEVFTRFFSSDLQTSGRAYNLDRLLWKSADGLNELSALSSNRDVQPGQSLCYSPSALLWAQKHLCTCHVSTEMGPALPTLLVWALERL